MDPPAALARLHAYSSPSLLLTFLRPPLSLSCHWMGERAKSGADRSRQNRARGAALHRGPHAFRRRRHRRVVRERARRAPALLLSRRLDGAGSVRRARSPRVRRWGGAHWPWPWECCACACARRRRRRCLRWRECIVCSSLSAAAAAAALATRACRGRYICAACVSVV